MEHLFHLVALAPAGFCALYLLVHLTREPLAAWYQREANTPALLELWRDNLNNAAWLGTATAAFFAKENSVTFWSLALVWFLVLQLLARQVSNAMARLQELEQEQTARATSKLHRWVAGAVRSIVQDELGKASRKQ